jgi:hypothetical protein
MMDGRPHVLLPCSTDCKEYSSCTTVTGLGNRLVHSCTSWNLLGCKQAILSFGRMTSLRDWFDDYQRAYRLRGRWRRISLWWGFEVFTIDCRDRRMIDETVYVAQSYRPMDWLGLELTFAGWRRHRSRRWELQSKLHALNARSLSASSFRFGSRRVATLACCSSTSHYEPHYAKAWRRQHCVQSLHERQRDIWTVMA